MYRYYLPHGCVTISTTNLERPLDTLEEQVISEINEQYNFIWIEGEWKPIPNVNVVKLTVLGGCIDECKIYTNTPIPLELHVSDLDVGTDRGFEPEFDPEMYG